MKPPEAVDEAAPRPILMRTPTPALFLGGRTEPAGRSLQPSTAIGQLCCPAEALSAVVIMIKVDSLQKRPVAHHEIIKNNIDHRCRTAMTIVGLGAGIQAAVPPLA